MSAQASGWVQQQPRYDSEFKDALDGWAIPKSEFKSANVWQWSQGQPGPWWVQGQSGLQRVFSTTQSKSYLKDKLGLTMSSSPASAGSELNRVQCRTLSSSLVWAL
jgi:hypothetical protein